MTTRMTLGLGLTMVVLAMSSACGVDVIDDGGGGSGAACGGYADEPGSQDVTVVFRNDSDRDVYLPTSCGTIRYGIEPDGADDDVSWVYDRSCLQTCQELQTQSQYFCGACQSETRRIPAGDTLSVVWSGAGLNWTTMPSACFFDPQSAEGCGQIVAAPAGSYRIDVEAFDGCSGECNCDANGVCIGDATGTPAYADNVTFTYPGSATVEVVFGVCAFGCAND